VAATVINNILLCQEKFYAVSEVLKLLGFVSDEVFCPAWSSLKMSAEAGTDAKGNHLDEIRRGVLGKAWTLIITPATIDVNSVIPAKAGIHDRTGFRIKSGMTIFDMFTCRNNNIFKCLSK
jgi:hypothetical protein